MKQTLFTFFILMTTCTLFAQNDSKSFTHQFGFDATGFIERFFNFSGNNSFGDTPYYLTYRKLGEKKNLRIGFGASLAVQGDGNDGTISANSLSLRIGTERFNDFGKRWRAFYGWDFKAFLAYNSSSGSGNNSTQILLGGSPLFGLQWRLNDRLSFSTELSYNLLFSLLDNNGTTRLGAATSFTAPRAIYAQYDF